MDRVIAYVDGFNLYFGMKSKGWKRFYRLDIPQLLRKMLKPSQRLVETKYFTNRVSASAADPDKPKRQNTYLEALQTLPGLSVFFGHYLQTSSICRTCGTSRLVQSEKMTDVNIATQLLADAFLDRFDTAFLISGDSDLVPPVKLIGQVFPKKWITVAFPPGRYSKWLANEAKSTYHIGRDKIATSQFPDPVIKPDGFRTSSPRKVDLNHVRQVEKICYGD